MKAISTRAVALLAAGLLLAVGIVSRAAEAPSVGAAPPEIDAKGWMNAEKPLTLASLKGKVAVVEFWATWCPPCRKSIPHLVEIHKKRAAEGVVIIGLSDEAQDKVEPFIKKMNVPYVIGYGSKSGDAYGVEGIPTAFIVGADGKLAWSGHPMDEGFEKALDAAVAKIKK